MLVIDIGGATTDIHSIASGRPKREDVQWKGLEEPYQKRTVEGNLGLRFNAPSILDIVGVEKLCTQYEKKDGLQTIVRKNLKNI